MRKQTNILSLAVFVCAIIGSIVFNSNNVNAAIKYDGPDDFLDIRKIHTLPVFDSPDPALTEYSTRLAECYDNAKKDNILDLTKYRGMSLSTGSRSNTQYTKDLDTSINLACLFPENSFSRFSLSSALYMGYVNSLDRYFDNYFFKDGILSIKDGKIYYKNDYILRSGDQGKVLNYAGETFAYKTYLEDEKILFSIPEITTPNSPVSAVMGEYMDEHFKITDRAGEWTISHKENFKYAIECLPSAINYNECKEIEYKDLHGGIHKIYKGKFISQDVGISRKIKITDSISDDKGGDNLISDSEKAKGVNIEAPNTGLEVGAWPTITIILSVLIVLGVFANNR